MTIVRVGTNSLDVQTDKFIWLIRRCFQLLVAAISSVVIVFIKSMTDEKKAKKRKQTTTQQTVADRSAIGANWLALLSSNNMGDEAPKKRDDKQTDRFTGTFRRARKKNKNNLNEPLAELQSLSITKQDNSKGKVLAPQGNERADEPGKLTRFVAMDCEMVGIGADGRDHMLARVSLVNRFGDCIYDELVQPREEVTDYRTKISGIRKEDMLRGKDFTVVQKEVSKLLRGRVLVGHSLKNDMAVLFLSHPKRMIRDTSRYKPFRKVTPGNTPSLKRLTAELLGVDIQSGEHSSVEDARAAMQLYCRAAREWEQQLSGKRKHRPETQP